MCSDRATVHVVLRGSERLVEVNGQDVTRAVTAVMLSTEGGEVKLGLKLVPDFELEGDGVVQVLPNAPSDPHFAIREFLRSVSPEQLSTDVLEFGDMSTNPMADALVVLQRYVDGT